MTFVCRWLGSGSSRWGPLFFTLLTALEKAQMSSPVGGAITARTALASVSRGSSQASQFSGATAIGIQSWIRLASWLQRSARRA
jgi:hypothetical protein